MSLLSLLADTAASTTDVQNHYGNLIFMGCFFIGVMIVGIWWLKRNS